MVRLSEAAKFSTFLRMSPSMLSPCGPTGWAAPMLVPGAIAAMFAAMVTKTPAEAAPAPDGAT